MTNLRYPPPPPADPSIVSTFKLRSGSKSYTVNAGDLVYVLPSKEGRRDGFDAKVLRARIDLATAELKEVEVVRYDDGTGRSKGNGAVRTFAPLRLKPKIQKRSVS